MSLPSKVVTFSNSLRWYSRNDDAALLPSDMTSVRGLFRLLLPILCIAHSGLAQSPGDTAFQQSIVVDLPDSSAFAFASYTIPRGKRLVIRYLAVSAPVPAGQRFTSSVQTTVLGSSAEYPQVYFAQSNGDGTDQLISAQSLTIQADGDTTVYLQVFRKIPRGRTQITFVISGDLIPMP